MRPNNRTLAITLFGLIPCWAIEVGAQQGQGPPCSTRCTVERVEYITLGSPTDPELVNVSTYVARDSRGRFYAAATGRSPVIAYDSKGKFITTIGRRGDGPGEFRRIGVIDVGPGDTLYVREAGGPISVFAPDYRFVRQIPASQSPSSAFLLIGAGRIVHGLTTNAEMDPIMALTDGRGWLGFFGAGREPLRCSECIIRAFAYRDERSFWAVPPYSYRLELWNLNGTLEKEIRPNSAWLSSEPSVRRMAGGKPSGSISGVASDRRGLVWIFGYAPRDNYSAPCSPVMHRPDGVIIKNSCPPIAPDSARKASMAQSVAVIDVIDPTSGVVIASARYQQDYLLKVQGRTSDVDGTLVQRADYADDGTSLVRVWQLTIRR